MGQLRTLTIAMAALGALVAVVAALGKLSGRLGDSTVNRLYYLSYGCSGLGIGLFILDGLFGVRP
jgi:hypothetical protein